MLKPFGRALYGVLFVLLSLACFGAADDIARLYNFQPNTTIYSSQVNGEFNQIISTLNAKVGRSVANTISGNNTFTGNNSHSGTETFSNAAGVTTDVVSERTSANGVAVDGLLIKDGISRPTLTADPGSPTDGDFWYESTTDDFRGRVNGSTGGIPVGVKFLSGPAPSYASANTITIPAGMAASDSTGAAVIKVPSNITLSLATSGAAGLDTGAEASSTWYYPALCKGSSGVTAVFSLSSSDPACPTNYNTYERVLPLAVRNDASSNIIPFVLANWGVRTEVVYDVSTIVGSTTTRVLNNGTSTSYAAVDCSAFIPPISTLGRFAMATNGGAVATTFRPTGGTTERQFTMSGGGWVNYSPYVSLNTSQSTDYKVDANQLTLLVYSYIVTSDL